MSLLVAACAGTSAPEQGADGGPRSAASRDAGPATDDVVVGTFAVQLHPPGDATAGSTKLIGAVSDGPSPAAILWSTARESGPCKLLTPKVPFCDPACGSDVCVEDGVCRAYPHAATVGQVTVSGVRTTSGASSFTIDPIAGNYQPPAKVTLAYPGVSSSDTVRIKAAGGDVAPFSLEARGIDPLSLAGDALDLSPSSPLALSWDAPDGSTSSVFVKLDVSHHGGTKGKIECDADDGGALEIPAELMHDLLALGAAGFPTIVVERRAVAAAATRLGRIELVVSSSVERAVSIPGVQSCKQDSDCPPGKTCQANLTCT